MSEEIQNENANDRTDEILRIIATHCEKQNKLLEEQTEYLNKINGKLAFFVVLIILGIVVTIFNSCMMI